MKRSLLVLLLALLLAAIGTASVFYYVSRADARALAGQRAVSVLIAGQPIPAGTTAEVADVAGVLRTERMPAGSVPADALAGITPGVAPLVAAADIQPGQLVLRSMFVAELPDATGLPIPSGKVAVTVELGVPQQVAGYVRAGSEVAVFDTYTELGDGGLPTGDGLPRGRDDVQATRVLLPRVEVLAVGPASADPAGGQQPAAASGGSGLFTVAVSQDQAELLILRSQTGSLHLALLTDDSRIAPGAGTDTHSLYRELTKGH